MAGNDGADGMIDLRAGDWAYLDGNVLRPVQGIEDASVLLSILFEPDSKTPYPVRE